MWPFVDLEDCELRNTMTTDLALRIRLFLSGDVLRHQMPAVARASLEAARKNLDDRAARKALWALDLSREPEARAERTAIFVAMKADSWWACTVDLTKKANEEILTDLLGKMMEANKKFLPVETGRTPYAPQPIHVDKHLIDTLRGKWKNMWPAADEYLETLHQFAKEQSITEPLQAVPAADWVKENITEVPYVCTPAQTIKTNVHTFQQSVLEDLAKSWPSHEKRFQVGIGQNKALLSILAPLHVLGCKVAARYIHPADLANYLYQYQKAQEDGLKLPSLVLKDKGFIVPGAPTLHVLTTTSLNRVEGFETLAALAPDVVIIDDHDFKPNTVRRYQVEKYFKEQNTHPKLIVWT